LQKGHPLGETNFCILNLSSINNVIIELTIISKRFFQPFFDF